MQITHYPREIYRSSAHKNGRVIAKLRELGWGKEIDNERGSYRRNRTLLINHPLVRQPKELTERSAYNIIFDLYILIFLWQSGTTSSLP